ncbi:unnamed protein product [Adineta ricciae]|uniref:ENTH domain-containing protein n=1 Tax=Adineta ricciae TaxID=249248 RepID=A0A813VM19_ADIRI|nr:unnamed protein product [Adineta ricciae]CAF1041468.1 unnamed protein product [Adineta ricciae]
MQPGGQSIVDRILAAKNTIAGQPVAKVVCKATTEELMGPKRKHLDCLLQATHEMNVSIPDIADLLIERSQNSSWIVSFKSLITIHHLMAYGNERFEAYMASHNHHLQTSIYTDRLGMGGSDMTTHLRRYAAYLHEKRDAYKLMGYDFCKIKRGKDDAVLRTLPTDKLLKTVPIVQKQLDALLEFQIASHELINGVINSCFFLLIKDLVQLYAAYNDLMINLLEKYFTMNKKQCREALDMYKKFIDRTDKVSQYFKVAESTGMEHNEIPDLAQAPNSLLEALENHLAHIEGKKLSSQPSMTSVNLNLNPQKAIEEEANALSQFNKKKELSISPPPLSPQSSRAVNGSNGFDDANLFAQRATTTTTNGHHQQQQQQQQQLFSNDIFSLAPTTSSSTVTNTFNPFDNTFSAPAPSQNMFDDLLQPVPTPTPTTKPMMTMPLFPTNQNIPPVVKPLQSGDLNSSLNQLIDNLDIKDHSKIGKDHQWTPNDGKGQQILNTIHGTTTTSGPTWANSTGFNAPFGNFANNVQSHPVWPQAQPPMMPATSTNPFTASNGSSQNNFAHMTQQASSFSTNPFAAQPSYGTSFFNQPQLNDPFSSL